MVIDSHTHVFADWPGSPLAAHGAPERLLRTMDAHGVMRALLVALIFKGGDSNAITLQAEHAHPDRFVALPQLDSMGTPTHHTAGAAERLTALHEAHGGIRGFAHYCRDYDWFATPEGEKLFAKAAALNHVVSIAVFAPGLAPLAALALRFPSVTFLVHHLGRLQEKNQATPDLAALRGVAATPNLWFKISGFHHLATDPRAYPHAALQPLVRALYDSVGPRRLVWGSDSPVVEQHLTYRQSLDLFRDHTPYLAAADKALILGGNLTRLLAWPTSK